MSLKEAGHFQKDVKIQALDTFFLKITRTDIFQSKCTTGNFNTLLTEIKCCH